MFSLLRSCLRREEGPIYLPSFAGQVSEFTPRSGAVGSCGYSVCNFWGALPWQLQCFIWPQKNPPFLKQGRACLFLIGRLWNSIILDFLKSCTNTEEDHCSRKSPPSPTQEVVAHPGVYPGSQGHIKGGAPRDPGPGSHALTPSNHTRSLPWEWLQDAPTSPPPL